MDVLIDGEIILYGNVGEDFQGEGFTAVDVVRALAQIGRATDVTVRINSGGGYADEGAAIYNRLANHEGTVTVVIDSVAASAASLIAMAGDDIVMRLGSYLMVHDPAGVTIGDSAAHSKSVEALETLAQSYANVYAERTGMTPDECRADMKAETWMTATQAVQRGYADRQNIMGAAEPSAYNYRRYAHAPNRMMALADARRWTGQHGRLAATACTEIVYADKGLASNSASREPDAEGTAERILSAYRVSKSRTLSLPPIDPKDEGQVAARRASSQLINHRKAIGR